MPRTKTASMTRQRLIVRRLLLSKDDMRPLLFLLSQAGATVAEAPFLDGIIKATMAE
ncbi:hypothetical protein X743_26330 [Mesorhizobium sp. LNHC252B00]|nr:hypothetical protein X743_26330 [Mesorhizobium sp. LNHC252B00]